MLKKDKLDETVSLEPIEKGLTYFISLFNLHLADNKVIDCKELLSHFVAVLKTGLDIAFVQSRIIELFINPKANDIDYLNLLKNYINDLFELCKKVRRRLIANTSPISLTTVFENEVRDCIVQVNKTISALHTIVTLIKKDLTQKLLNSNEVFIYPNIESMNNIINTTGGFKFLEVSLNAILTVCNQLSIGFQQGDFEVDSKCQKETFQELQKFDPIETRAKFVTQQSGQLSELKVKLENKENEVNELKKLVKIKIDEAEEMKIRKDVAEKKLTSANKNLDKRGSKFQVEIDELRNILKKKEKEYEETLIHFQADIEAL